MVKEIKATGNELNKTNNIEEKRMSFMREAIRLSIENVKNGGGPFGAVIVKDDEIIATGVNRVTSQHDPTAHAEVSAIRAACSKLNIFDLSGCEIYTSCEPCPMCLGAIYWAHLDKLYYANTKDDAKDIGFDDAFIYEEMDLPIEKRKLPYRALLRNEAIEAFNMWKNKSDKIEY
jgi:tRNA(Arg) A34 adenosine deaminase TadA